MKFKGLPNPKSNPKQLEPDMDIPIENSASEWCALRKAKLGEVDLGYFSFYSSATGAITTNAAIMDVPIDDHAVVRGHAVFDTCSLVNGRMYRLNTHLDRLFDSARKARLPLPFGTDEEVNRARMIEIVAATARASQKSSCDMRYWLTAGTGNLGVTPNGCSPGFYVLAFGGLPMPPSWGTEGIPEASVPSSLVPLKPPHLAELKSNNYMLNALTMLAAKDRGGTFGIAVNADGFILESCVLNVVVVGKDGILRTPPFARLLRGCTIRKVLELAKEHLLTSEVLKGVQQEPVTLEACYEASEIFLVAGDTHIYSCTSLDGHQLGEGKPGPVFQGVKRLLLEDARTNEGEIIRI